MIRFGLALVISLALPAVAGADAQPCFDAAVAGQKQRAAGKLLAARERFIACAKGCPDEVQKDCAKWLAEVDEIVPTVVFGANDGAGRDLLDVRVSVDGVGSGDTSQGQPVALDPGAHSVRFERDGHPPVERTLVVRVGEKNRRVVVEFAKRESTSVPGVGVPTATWILGGIGVLGLGAFTFFGARGLSDHRRYGCDVGCSPSEKSSVDAQFLVADVGLLVGIGSLAAATVVWAVRPKTELAVTRTHGGAAAALTIRF